MSRLASCSSVFAASLIAVSPAAALAQLPPQPATADANTEDVKLKKLFHDSDEDMLQQSPITAIFRGDLRYADRPCNYLAPEFTEASPKANEADRNRLRATTWPMMSSRTAMRTSTAAMRLVVDSGMYAKG